MCIRDRSGGMLVGFLAGRHDYSEAKAKATATETDTADPRKGQFAVGALIFLITFGAAALKGCRVGESLGRKSGAIDTDRRLRQDKVHVPKYQRSIAAAASSQGPVD